ncbi:MAG: hypothetical protein MHM6MM_003669, partial [Cercozoa sp. M6MM]
RRRRARSIFAREPFHSVSPRVPVTPLSPLSSDHTPLVTPRAQAAQLTDQQRLFFRYLARLVELHTRVRNFRQPAQSAQNSPRVDTETSGSDAASQALTSSSNPIGFHFVSA